MKIAQSLQPGGMIHVDDVQNIRECVVDVSKAWIQTSGGGIFHILDPQQSEISILDIAHSLSKMCRWTGHTRKFYSVAEHSWHTSHLVPKEDALWALLHDASEAYISDMNRPLKHFTPVGTTYLQVEKKIMNAICQKFHLSIEPPATIHEADNGMLYAEKEQLMPPVQWETKWGMTEKPSNVKIRCWGPEVAEAVFLYRYYELTDQL